MSSHTLQPELESCRVGLGRALALVPEVSCCAFTDACDDRAFAESTGTKKTTVNFQINRINVQGNEPTSY